MKTDGLKAGVHESPSPQSVTDSPLEGESASGPCAVAKGPEGSAKVTPTKGPEVTPQGQKGKSLPLEKQTAPATAPETAPSASKAPPAGTAADGGPLPTHLSAPAPGQVVQPSEAPAKSDGKRTSKAVQDTHGAGSLAALAAVAATAAAAGGDSKEVRGKRYTSLQSVRKGLAQVANELAIPVDLKTAVVRAKTAAVRVQALQSIANVLALEEQARLEAQTAQVEAQIKAMGGPRA